MSRFWNNNPELLDEITIKCLPEPWRTKCEEGECEIYDVPEDMLCKAMGEGLADYSGSRIDDAVERYKNDVIQLGKEAADKLWKR